MLYISSKLNRHNGVNRKYAGRCITKYNKTRSYLGFYDFLSGDGFGFLAQFRYVDL